MKRMKRELIVRALYQEYFKVVKEFGLPFDVYPDITLSGQLKKFAGTVHCKWNRETGDIIYIRIAIARSYFEKFGWDRMKKTLRHEIAHVACRAEYKVDCDHDNRFKAMCQKLGGTMNKWLAGQKYADCATNDYIDHLTWLYTCPGCGGTKKMTRRMDRRKRLSNSWHCAVCKTKLIDWSETRL